MSYLWVACGSAIGGVFRFGLSQLMGGASRHFPFNTLLINVLGSFVIGYFGTLTLSGTKYAVSPNTRLFVMVGFCGGFTTFSAFSLQSLDLLRSGAWGRALANVTLSVALCLGAVAVGHQLAGKRVDRAGIAQSQVEETG